MTYKEIVKKIEYYEKKHTEAFMIYYDHEVTEAKQRMYDTALNRKNAALSALLDFCRIYRNENKVKYLEDFYAGLEVIKSQAKAKNEKTKLEDLEEFEAIYKTIIDSAFALEGKDFLKLVKYGEEKRRQHLKKDKKEREENEKNIINDLIDEVNSNFKIYLEAKHERENRVFHVGTPKEEVSAYVNLITSEEVKYTLLSKAIEEALESAHHRELVNDELILYFYEQYISFPESRERYEDDKAYELSQNGYSNYKETFEKTYKLSRDSRKNLKKELDYSLNKTRRKF